MQFQTTNPATGETLQTYTFEPESQLTEKLGAAHQAFLRWRNTPLKTRTDCLLRLAEQTEAQSQRLAALLTQEMGKPLSESRSELQKCVRLCRFYAEQAADFLSPQEIASEHTKSYVRFDPLGVILGIMPWNFPFWQVYRYALPALLAGNTTLLKHAPNTTGCGLEIARLFEAAGFPKGVFQTILAHTDDIPKLIADRRVQGVTLTGSEKAGAAVAAEAGRNLKKTVLELGGSDPFIVLPDADLQTAAKIGVQARLLNTGQSCIAAKRFLIHDAVYDEFLSDFKQELEAYLPADPASEAAKIGCLARNDLSDKLEQQIRESVSKGAIKLVGGERKGNFFTPCILTNISPGMPAYHEEFFGPVALFFRLRNEAEIIQLANDTDYGLGASLWTADLEKAEHLAQNIEAGSVFVNQLVHSDPRFPFGGVKQSGYGRELSSWGTHEFTNVKTVVLR